VTTTAAAVQPAAYEEHRTSTGLDNRKVLMWAFLGSECLFFGSLISVYLVYRGRSIVGPIPDQVYDIPYTSVSAFVLLASSLFMVLALNAIQRGSIARMRVWLIAVAVLGCIFIGGQIYEFSVFYEEGLRLDTNLFGSSFFVLTGFHGAHVTVGIIWLLSLVISSFRGALRGPDGPLNVEIAGLYWHFVDIVWIIIFALVYLVR
jgi:heme/copper-type cytochrome/quinol oxidase subunit 3